MFVVSFSSKLATRTIVMIIDEDCIQTKKLNIPLLEIRIKNK